MLKKTKIKEKKGSYLLKAKEKDKMEEKVERKNYKV